MNKINTITIKSSSGFVTNIFGCGEICSACKVHVCMMCTVPRVGIHFYPHKLALFYHYHRERGRGRGSGK